MQKNISVIISTYNSVEWLKKVIWGYNTQTYRNFEMVIADDGSRQETFDLIEKLKKEEDYQPILLIIRSLVLAEIIAPSQGTKGAGNVRLNFNSFIKIMPKL